MEDDQIDKDSSLILILCDEKLERPYALQFCEIAEDRSLEFRFVSDPKLFLLLCLQNPPAVGLIDLAALIRGKTEGMNKLFAIRSVWPVLRSRIGSDGSAEIMRMSPPLKGPFQEAIINILDGGSAWENAIESRMYLRCPVTCRARLRVAGSDDEWSRVNSKDLSRGGCLVVASTPPATGTRIEIEVCDLPGGSAVLDAEIVWSCQWEDSPDVPQCGVRFVQESFPEILHNALGDPTFAQLL